MIAKTVQSIEELPNRLNSANIYRHYSDRGTTQRKHNEWYCLIYCLKNPVIKRMELSKLAPLCQCISVPLYSLRLHL